MTLNMARADPIFFSNNVIETVRDRLHIDNTYFSFSETYVPTEEGVYAVDSLIAKLSNTPKMNGLKWNNNLGSFMNKEEMANINVFNTNIFEM